MRSIIFISKSHSKFVIFPSPREGYNLQTVPTSFKNTVKTQRVSFPEEWFTKVSKDGRKNSDSVKEDFPGIIFWNRSFACFDTLEHAKEAAYRLINTEDNTDTLSNMVSPIHEWIDE